MLATNENLPEVIDRFTRPGHYGADTETTGLYPYLGDRLFSIILSDAEGAVYFNFQDYGDDTPFFRDTGFLRPVFLNENATWFMHNAKFDLAMLRFAGLYVKGVVHCTQAVGRVIRNDKLKYSLDVLARERGLEKSDAVEKYIQEHGLWAWREIPGKKKREKDKFYNKVPFDVVYPYGLTDGRIERALGLHQIADIETVAATTPVGKRSIRDVYLNELEVVKACFEMEWAGAAVDTDYINTALEHEEARRDEAGAKFEALTGHTFKDSPKALAGAFDAIGVPYKRNQPTDLMKKKAAAKGVEAVGNPCFKKDALEGVEHEAARHVLDYRGADKRAGTYYHSFLYFKDENDRIHCDFRQDGTGTGRMSAAQPNLQNVPKRGEDKSQYPVRKAFVPPPGYCLLRLDYEQMEYRLMLEYARQTDLVERVAAGHDVHDATAAMITEAGVTCERPEAKNINFMMIYGGGVGKLAQMSGLPLEKAQIVREAYKQRLPKVWQFIRNVIYTAEHRGFIVNWFGRRCHFDDPNFCYKAPNYLIQGGCADIVKVAMVGCVERLQGLQSKLILQVHDELVFQMHEDELDLAPELVKIMENAYPHKLLPLTVGVEHSWDNWHEKTDGYPSKQVGS